MKRNAEIHEALGFDDVLLVPSETQVKPADVSTVTRLTRTISLNIPLISAGLDHVTEGAMAIAMARLGGLGVIHDNMPVGRQVEEVRRVKRSEGNMVLNPITISPDASVSEALDLMTTYKVSGLPVIEQASQKVAGIITSRDVRFFEDYARPVSELMSKEVVTVKQGVDMAVAKRLLHQHRIEKLVVLDAQDRCVGLITVQDIDKLETYPHAARDPLGRLRVGAAIGAGKDAFERAMAMTDAGLDVVFIDVAHAHTREVAGLVSRIRQQRSSEVQTVAGNITTPDAARSLIDAGADAIKVACGAGSIGIGMPSITALLEIADICGMADIPMIAGGNILCAASIAKAIGAGAEAVVLGRLFAGTEEAPGMIAYQGMNAYKIVNPAAKPQHRPPAGTPDPYHVDKDPIDTTVPYRGPVAGVAQHLIGGLKAAMALTGSRDIRGLIDNARFVRTTT